MMPRVIDPGGGHIGFLKIGALENEGIYIV